MMTSQYPLLLQPERDKEEEITRLQLSIEGLATSCKDVPLIPDSEHTDKIDRQIDVISELLACLSVILCCNDS